MHFSTPTTFALASAFVSVNAALDPDSVPLSQRTSWCQSETATCPNICLTISSGEPETNECDSTDLSFSCVCGNGKSPNLTEYTLTMPYFTCTQENDNCVADCSDNTCQSKCRTDNPCGAQDPNPPNKTKTSTASSTSSTASNSNEVYDGMDGSNSSSASTILPVFLGLLPLLGSVMVGFAML